jgi:uncharacterized protein with NAD-binding domain and iron-sulfur cluster
LAGDRPIEVAIIGGGCASVAAAFDLTRPELKGKYHCTVYQLGWRLGGKGASGRGPAGRIEEHGLHVWMGFYENAFRLMRECYAELGRNSETCPITDWQHAFVKDPYVGVADRSIDQRWMHRRSFFPTNDSLPGDPLDKDNPFTVAGYLVRTAALLKTLLIGVRTEWSSAPYEPDGAENDAGPESESEVSGRFDRVFELGLLATSAGLIEAVGLLEVIFRLFPNYPQNSVLRMLQGIAASIRLRLESVVIRDEDIRYKWEVIDLVIAIMVGIVRDGLMYHPKGFDAINHYECAEWLRMHGASERASRSSFVRGLYDVAFAYGKDGPLPGLAAGQAIRGSLRMLFTYRGSMFWKMQAGMGDVVFAPFYEALKKRGVKFEFFHRLRNVRLAEQDALKAGERPYVTALDFDVQARFKGGKEYEPLVEVKGLPCWPSEPDFSQLAGGDKKRREGWQFESHWDDRKVATKTLKVIDDFDFVVLGVGVGAIPHVCKEFLKRDSRWRAMCKYVTSTETQAFQLWLRKDMKKLGWGGEQINLSAFVQPFASWADMRQLIPAEDWDRAPGAIGYFCNAMPDDPEMDTSDPNYPALRNGQARENAIRFLKKDIGHLWPKAVTKKGKFRWKLLMDPEESADDAEPKAKGKKRFDSQFWTANTNPSDRYVLAPPGSMEYRISPLDNTYDNLTIAGDWTECGFNEGCVEAAVMSGRLAAHAIAGFPELEDIIGYDHP